MIHVDRWRLFYSAIGELIPWHVRAGLALSIKPLAQIRYLPGALQVSNKVVYIHIRFTLNLLNGRLLKSTSTKSSFLRKFLSRLADREIHYGSGWQR